MILFFRNVSLLLYSLGIEAFTVFLQPVYCHWVHRLKTISAISGS